MARRIFRPSVRLFLSIVSVVAVAGFSASAFAQATTQNVAAGCSASVWNALTAKAEAQVAYDAAVTRQMINKPQSVLTLTCFDQAAGVSGTEGGAIFSGSFTSSLQSAGLPVTGGGAYVCTQIGTLWNTIVTEGINNSTPYATFNDLLQGTMPTPSPNTPAIDPKSEFATGWNTASTAQVFKNLQKTVSALPTPTTLDFSTAKSSCEVLSIAKIINQSCPQGGSGALSTPTP